MKINPVIIVFVAIAVLLILFTVLIPVPIKEITQLSTNGSVIKKSNLPNLGKAPELQGIHAWHNSEALKIEELKGKVVLVDFWTYSCINCIRTLPYLKSWHEKYADDGLVIIGVHTPEFEFEKDYNNVKAAIEKYGIKYAVAQDNDYATWRAYKNRYWPRKYLIDAAGNIRYDHIGEGAYAETEEVIIQLLEETGKEVQENMTQVQQQPEYRRIGTPEIFLGYDFARSFLGNKEGFSPDNIVYYEPADAEIINLAYLEGKWKNNKDNMESINNSKLSLLYVAKDLNIVAGGAGKIEVLVDGKYLDETNKGSDVKIIDGKSIVNIEEERLYHIVSAQDYGSYRIDIIADPGIRIYTLTFG